jgi:hypothetical protein
VVRWLTKTMTKNNRVCWESPFLFFFLALAGWVNISQQEKKKIYFLPLLFFQVKKKITSADGTLKRIAVNLHCLVGGIVLHFQLV